MKTYVRIRTRSEFASGKKIVWLNFAQWRLQSYRHR